MQSKCRKREATWGLKPHKREKQKTVTKTTRSKTVGDIEVTESDFELTPTAESETVYERLVRKVNEKKRKVQEEVDDLKEKLKQNKKAKMELKSSVGKHSMKQLPKQLLLQISMKEKTMWKWK